MTTQALDPDALRVLDDPVEQGAFTRWRQDATGRRIAESSLRLSGLHCAACAPAIEAALHALPGVLEVHVSAAARCATVRWDAARTAPSALVQAVRRAGYDALPDTAAAARGLRRAERRQMTWRVFVAGFCAMQVMMMAAPAYLGAPGDLAPDLKRLLDWGAWLLTLPVLLFSARPFFAGAWRSLAARRIGMDVPVALGIAVAFVASSGAAVRPGGLFGSDVYFDSLTMFVSFLLMGRWLEMAARHRAAEQLEDAFGRLPQQVQRVLADGRTEAVSALRLLPGDRVRVPAGQAFAADGVLLAGRSSADEALLSGESQPVPKAVGDAVVAGSLNLGAPVEMRVERVGADTRHEAILALMREAATQRPALARAADRWAGPFLWAVLLLAAGAAALWSLIDPARAVAVAVAVLIVTCPCALSLAVPSALLAAAGRSARDGLLLRRLDALETLGRVQQLFIDKTGTLTEGHLACTGVRVLQPGAADAELRGRVASLAAWSQHPVAQALAALGPANAFAWHDVRELAGQGLEAVDAQGCPWRLGSAAWTGAGLGAGTVWLACEGQPVAVFDIGERLRDGVPEALAALRADGVQVTLLSGDRPERVAALAQRLQLNGGGAGLSPAQKLAVLREAQAQGRIVAMLGDGINDAPVLAQADVSIAMGEGAAVARAQADAVLLGNRLQDLVAARRLARRATRVLRQNLAWAAAYNAACVPLALAGLLPPWAAGLGMAASSLFVVLNSLRLARA